MSNDESKLPQHLAAALDLPAGAQRDAYLDAVCGADGPLREQLEAMLQAHQQGDEHSTIAPDREDAEPSENRPSAADHEATGHFDHGRSAAAETAATSAKLAAARGTRIRYMGDYEIERELGQGGMGTVYQARQISLNRQVAVKTIRSGAFANDEEVRRFHNEADAAALLDHPGIVPIYEVGEHQGKHFFSMKLIEGGSLVARMESYRSDPRGAARLVAATADAVAHAHMRGILHRDLKPANLLIDEKGGPHITDFGLAKRVESDMELTQSGQILGTPAYMSPEQASGRRGSVTTASDVYSLGAVLYALLTGQAPFGGDSVVETLDAVRNQPPVAPVRLNPSIPRGLQTITLKCLEKDPRRRYPTAQSLCEDLDAWLGNRPLRARRVGLAERGWLWCKRHPAIASLSAATVLTLAVGVLAVIGVQAKANRELAIENAATKRAELLADERLDRAMAAIADYYTGVSADALTGEQIPLDLREQLLAKPREFYQELTDELAAKQAPSRREQRLLAEGQLGLGNILSRLGRLDEARRAGDAAKAVFESMIEAEPDKPEHQSGLATCCILLGDVLSKTGEAESARDAHETAIRLGKALVSGEPDVPHHKAELARAYTAIGNLRQLAGETEAAIDAHRESIALSALLASSSPEDEKQQSSLASAYSNLGLALGAAGQLEEARAAHASAIEIQEELVEEHPDLAAYRRGLADSLSNLGYLLQTHRDFAASLAAHRDAGKQYKALVGDHPGVPDYQQGLATSFVNIGGVLNQTGDTTAARAALLQAIESYKFLVASRPGVPEYQNELATTYLNLGIVYRDLGDEAAAIQAYLEAIALQGALAAEYPDVPAYRFGLAASRGNLANVYRDAGDLKLASDSYRQGIPLLEELRDTQPNEPNYKYALSAFHINLGLLLREQGDLTGARDAFRLSLENAIEGTPVANELPQRLREIEEEIAASGRLAAVLAGDEAPRDAAEQLTFARLCYNRMLYAASAQFFESAFAADPSLADDWSSGQRFRAAGSAALASGGQGKDDPPLDAAEKWRLRRQALDWLTADLDTAAKMVEAAPPKERFEILSKLNHWRTDMDLAEVQLPLAGIPASERPAWRALWERVDELLKSSAN